MRGEPVISAVLCGGAGPVSGPFQGSCAQSPSYFLYPKSIIIADYKHRQANFDPTSLIILEAQIGDYLGEDDIVRFDDVYERIPEIGKANFGGSSAWAADLPEPCFLEQTKPSAETRRI